MIDVLTDPKYHRIEYINKIKNREYKCESCKRVVERGEGERVE